MPRFRRLICIGALVSAPALDARTPQLAIAETLPGVSKMSLSNAVGVLSYCRENALLGSESLSGLLDQLSSRSDPGSEDYIVGSSGQILGDAGKNFSIFRAPANLQAQACTLVLDRSKEFTR